MRLALLALAATMTLTAPAVAQEAPEGGAWIDCAVGSVAAFRDRVVVKCSNVPAGGEAPREFAMEMNDRLADVVLKFAVEAKGRGKPLGLLYVKATPANPAGCAPERCRRIAAVELK